MKQNKPFARPTGALRCAAPAMSVAVRLAAFNDRTLWLELLHPEEKSCVGEPRSVQLILGDVGKLTLRVLALDAPEPADGLAHPHAEGLLRATLDVPSRRALRTLGQYALRYSEAEPEGMSPDAVRRMGLVCTDVTPFMTLSTAHNDAEWAAVRKLRYTVFDAAHLLRPHQTRPEDVIDPRDAESHIITGYFRGQLVASCRAYCMRPQDAYDFDPWLQDASLLPPKEASVELGRLAIDPRFRGAHIPQLFIRMLAEYALMHQRRYLVLGTSASLLPFYCNAGFEVTPITFTYPGSTNIASHVLVADLHALWEGRSGNLAIWHLLFGGLTRDHAKALRAPTRYIDRLRLEWMRHISVVSAKVRAELEAPAPLHQWVNQSLGPWVPKLTRRNPAQRSTK
jgi:predicted GNAT family N-acyltransferase